MHLTFFSCTEGMMRMMQPLLSTSAFITRVHYFWPLNKIFLGCLQRQAASCYCHFLLLTYSSVPNRRACTFINSEKKNPPCTVLFCSACLLILRKSSPLHVYSILHVYCYWHVDTLGYFRIL